MDDTQISGTNTPTRKDILKWVLVTAFIVAAVLTAALTYITVRDFVSSWSLTGLPGVAITKATSTPDASGVISDPGNPMQPVGGPTPEPWDGASRVTVLVMGLDYGDWSSPDREGPPRTDTMILFTMDPLAMTGGILSIPRDLWVNIPGGFNYGKINTAYQLGEAYDLPAGGPGLAMETVEELLGVPIDYYAQVDFYAFERMIDEIGGVKLDVPEKIKVDPLGDDNIKVLKPGVQTLPGYLALAYARARKTEGADFDRAQRQQQVIMAIRERILSFEMMPMLISKAPVLYNEISSGVHTNLSLEQAIQLAWLALQISQDNIKRGIIGPPDQVSLGISPDGLEVLKPITDKIRLLRDEIFTEMGSIGPSETDMSPVELAKAEGARLSVLNGSTTAGLAGRTTDFLKTNELNVTVVGNADDLYNSLTLFDYTGKPYTIKYLIELMGISSNRIFSRYDPTSEVDLVIILGTDWAQNNTMP